MYYFTLNPYITATNCLFLTVSQLSSFLIDIHSIIFDILKSHSSAFPQFIGKGLGMAPSHNLPQIGIVPTSKALKALSKIPDL